MSSARRAAVLPLAVALGGVLLASVPAYAAVSATWAKPTDNATFTRLDPVEFSASLDRGRATLTTPADGSTVHLELTVPGPNPGPYKVDSSSGTGDKDLRFTFTPACPNYAGACSASGPAYNGRYTASVSGANAGGTRTIVLQVPPAAPTGVTAEAVGQHRIKVSWAANREPDVTGYDVFNANGSTVATNLPATTTSHEFSLPDKGYGGEHSYMVRAHRLTCANCDSVGTLASPMSATASVTLDEPTAEPAPGGGDGGTGEDPGDGSGDGDGDGGDGDGGGGYDGDPGSGGNTGGSGDGGGSGGDNGGSGGTPRTDENGYETGTSGSGPFTSGESKAEAVKRAQQRLTFGLTFKSFAPKLGAPKLPPLPQFAAPSPEEIPWGTYDPTLNYGDQTVIDAEPRAATGGITNTLVDSITMAFQGRKLYTSIALAMLLLLAAGHLRLWLRLSPEA